jgi:hypothetical protein
MDNPAQLSPFLVTFPNHLFTSTSHLVKFIFLSLIWHYVCSIYFSIGYIPVHYFQIYVDFILFAKL